MHSSTTNERQHLIAAENIALRSMLADPQTVLGIVFDSAIPIQMETSTGIMLLETMISMHKGPGLTLTGLYTTLEQIIRSEKPREAILQRLNQIVEVDLKDEPSKAAGYAIALIRDYKLKSIVLTSIEDLKKSITSETASRDQILFHIDSIFSRVAANMGSQASHSLGETIRELVNPDKPTPLFGIPSGFPIMDAILHGLLPGLYVIMGGAGSGKSTFLANIATNIALAGRKILVINIEMTELEWQYKTLSMISEVPEDDIKAATYVTNEKKKIAVEKALTTIENWNNSYYFEYMPGLQMEAIRYHIINYVFRHNIDAVLFDHIKAPEGDTDQYTTLGALTTMLKNLSGMLNIPILAAAQARRGAAAGKNVLNLDDIADSHAISRDANIMWGIKFLKEITDPYIPNTILNIAKHRSGMTDIKLGVYWNRPCSKMKEGKIIK